MYQNKQLIILAAGHGTRLYPLTLTMPKLLLSVNQKPAIYNMIIPMIHDGLRDEGLCFIISTDGRTNRTYWREVNPVSLVDIESMQSKMFCNLIEAAMDLESYLMINYEQCIWDLVYEIKS